MFNTKMLNTKMINKFRHSQFASVLLLSIIGCNTNVDEKITEVKPDQIKIGIMAPFTGPLAGFGQDFEATARLAAQQINQANGVNGREIGFLVRDTHLGLDDSIPISQQMAQQLIDEGVIAIIGPAGSGTAVNIAPITISQGIPLITPSATSPALSTLNDNDLVWRTVASDAFQGIFLADQLIADNKKTISIIFRDDAYGVGLAQATAEQFTQAGGTVLTSVSYPAAKNNNFDSEVNQIFSAGTPDALVVISFVIDGANIMVSLANANLNTLPSLYGVDGNKREEFLTNSPPQIITGMRGSSPVAPSTLPNYVAFSNSYEKVFHKQPPIFTESVYDAVYLMAIAMSVGGENSSLAIRDNLRSVSRADTNTPLSINVGTEGYLTAQQNLTADIDLQGAAGAIDFDENGDVTSGNYIFWEIVQQNGELVYKVLSETPFP